MKRFTLVVCLLATTLIESCGNPDPKVTGVSVVNTNPPVQIPTFSANGKTYPIEKGSDGHDYYFIDIGVGGYSSRLYPFHYPACKMCATKDSTIISLLTKAK